MSLSRSKISVLIPLLISFAVVGINATPCSNTTSSSRKLHVAHQTRGVLTISFDPSNPDPENSIQILNSIQAGYQPGWLCTHDDGILYSVSRTHFPDNSSTSGGIFALQIGPDSLGLIGSTASDGDGGVFCDISKDGTILSVANIDGSTVSLHPRNTADGAIGEAFQVFKYNLTNPGPGLGGSQNQSNPHQAIFDPSSNFMFVPDRGADFLYGYQVVSHTELRQVANVTLPPGTGARHIGFQVIDISSTLMYLVSELDNTVRVFRLDGVDNSGAKTTSPSSLQNLEISLLQVASTLGPGSDRTAPVNKELASEIAFSNDGRFVYVANRNTDPSVSDTLAIFATQALADETSEPLLYLGHNNTYGKIPRHFSISSDPDSLYVAVANEVTNNIIIMERDTESGFLKEGILGNLTLGQFDQSLSKGPMAVVWA